MPIDPTGTAPGLTGQVPEEPKHLHMKCKNPSCDSISVVEVHLPNNPGRHLYRCVKCHTSWGVMTGGSVDLG
jgi:transposase-like protein